MFNDVALGPVEPMARTEQDTAELPLDLFVTRRGSFALVTSMPLPVLALFAADRYGWIALPYEESPEVSSLEDPPRRFITIGEPRRTFVSVVSVTSLIPAHGAYYRLTEQEEARIIAMVRLSIGWRSRIRGLSLGKITLAHARSLRGQIRSTIDMEKALTSIPKNHRAYLIPYMNRQTNRLRRDPNGDTTGFIFLLMSLAERLELGETYLV
jgi:hypothetical protein